jgi:hypothetical protein
VQKPKPKISSELGILTKAYPSIGGKELVGKKRKRVCSEGKEGETNLPPEKKKEFEISNEARDTQCAPHAGHAQASCNLTQQQKRRRKAWEML